MNLANFSAILSAIGQLPTAALFFITCVLSGIGIGIGMSLRDIPKYFHKTIVAILNFILILTGKEQISVSYRLKEGNDNNNVRKIFEVIEGGKSDKKEERHKDGHAT